MSSSVVPGSSLDTRFAAPSCSAPAGWPLASRSIRPSAGSGVEASIPASRSAAVFTQAPCPSRLGKNAGRPPVTASSGSRLGRPPRKAWPSKTVPLWKMISSSVIDTATSGEPGGSCGETQSLAYGYVNIYDKIYDSRFPLLRAMVAGGPLRFLELDDDGHDPYAAAG